MKRIRTGCFAAASAIFLHLSPGIAWAQQDGVAPEAEETWLKWAVAAGLAVIICITGFINARRSHLT